LCSVVGDIGRLVRGDQTVLGLHLLDAPGHLPLRQGGALLDGAASGRAAVRNSTREGFRSA
jgi:hypothetical protein